MESYETYTVSPGSSSLQRKSMTADEADARARVEALLQQLSDAPAPYLDIPTAHAAASLDKVRRSIDRMVDLSQSMHEQLSGAGSVPSFEASQPSSTQDVNARLGGAFWSIVRLSFPSHAPG